MTKNELVNIISREVGVSRATARKMINIYNEVVMIELRGGRSVKLANFGTFEPRVRKAKKGINPRNPEESIIIPERIAPCFRPSGLFKSFVNKYK